MQDTTLESTSPQQYGMQQAEFDEFMIDYRRQHHAEPSMDTIHQFIQHDATRPNSTETSPRKKQLLKDINQNTDQPVVEVKNPK
jgi:hypothetical protein